MKQYTGRTLEEALGTVAQEQACSVSEIVYNVIDEEKGGIFGIHKSVTIEAFTSRDVKEFIFDYLGSYFTELDKQVSIEIVVGRSKDEDKKGEPSYHVNVETDDDDFAKSVIGVYGHTITAVGMVVRTAVSTTFKKRIDVTVDINHYKEKRYKKLRMLARREAINVLKTHVDVALDPMPNDERKVIHQYLQDFKGVVTQSEGDRNKRHLCIKYVGKKSQTNNATKTEVEETVDDSNTQTEA